MKKLLLVLALLMLSGCVAVPVYDNGYYSPYYGYYGPYPYLYGGTDVTFFISGSHGGHHFRGGHVIHGSRHDFRGGRHDFRGSGHGFRGGGYGGGRGGGGRR